MLEALTVKDMSNRILEREEFLNDNDMVKKNYKREMIRTVLNAYMEEMRLAFLDGERVYLPTIGTLIPEVCVPDDDILKVSDMGRKLNQQRAEEEHQANLRMQERREREERELQERRAKHDATINGMLAKKKAEQDAIEKKKKEEAEKAEIYKHIERLMETSPKAAEAYAEIYANKLKKI